MLIAALLAAMLMHSTFTAAQTTVNGLCYRNSAQTTAARAGILEDALADADCGATVELVPGHYSGDAVLSANCPADRPLILRGAPPQTGHDQRTSDALRASSRRDRPHDRGWPHQSDRIGESHHSQPIPHRGWRGRSRPRNQIDHNEFFTPGGNGIDIALQLSAGDRQPSRDNLINSNLFHSRGGSAESRDHEDEGRRPSVNLSGPV